MSIYKITSQNFELTQNKVLQIKIPDNIFVMFKLQSCVGCSSAEPIFSQMAAKDRRVSYGIVDLTNDRGIIASAKLSSTPIEKVPLFILYTQGRPHAKFKGSNRTYETLENFLTGALSSIQNIQQIPYQQPSSNTQSFVPNMYGGQSQETHINAPQIGNGGNSRNGGPGVVGHSSMQKQCDPDDEECLKTPDNIIPRNMPWEVDIRKLTSY
jgi:hypothetical protein